MDLQPLAVSFFAGLVIPAVVDFVTKTGLDHKVKAFLAACLSALAGVLTTIVWAPGERWQDYALAVATAFVTTFTAHRTGYSDVVQRKTARVGLG